MKTTLPEAMGIWADYWNGYLANEHKVREMSMTTSIVPEALRPELHSRLTMPQPDMVNHPPHYTQGKVECLDALEAAATGDDPFNAYLRCAAIKYLWRAGKKHDAKEDLDKAIFYINRLKARL